MSDDQQGPAVIRFGLRTDTAEKRIRELAAVSDNVVLGAHAREQMGAREIDDIDVFRVLRNGMILDAPEPAQPGEWKCKVVKKMKGGRDIGVVVIILPMGKLFVKTVEWEDLK